MASVVVSAAALPTTSATWAWCLTAIASVSEGKIGVVAFGAGPIVRTDISTVVVSATTVVSVASVVVSATTVVSVASVIVSATTVVSVASVVVPFASTVVLTA